MTNAERQAAYRARQREKGRQQRLFLVTEDEAFYLERVLEQMRRNGSTPAQMRRKNGTLEALDA